jgi:MarR family transcriptional regulator, lower aerobic nicotinate degradation pathway regulator
MQMPTWLLSQASLRAHQLLVETLATAGARGYDYRLLAALVEFGPASQATLSRRTGIDRSDVVATVNELADRGYVKRTIDAADRRRNLVSITTQGRARYKRLDTLVLQIQDQLLAPLSASERQVLTSLLLRVVEKSPTS